MAYNKIENRRTLQTHQKRGADKMTREKLNISLSKQLKESIKAEAFKRGVTVSNYIRQLHEKDLREQQGLEAIRDLGIMEELTKQMTETIIKHASK